MRIAGFVVVLGVALWSLWQARQAVKAAREARRLFEARLEALHGAIAEGFLESEAEAQRVPDLAARFKRTAVDYCSMADIIVYEVAPSKGYAMAAKLGQC